MRHEFRANIPVSAGGVTEAKVPRGEKCRCRRLATLRYRNIYRVADVCERPACRTEAHSWVGNTPYVNYHDKRPPTLYQPNEFAENLAAGGRHPKPRPAQPSRLRST